MCFLPFLPQCVRAQVLYWNRCKPPGTEVNEWAWFWWLNVDSAASFQAALGADVSSEPWGRPGAALCPLRSWQPVLGPRAAEPSPGRSSEAYQPLSFLKDGLLLYFCGPKVQLRGSSWRTWPDTTLLELIGEPGLAWVLSGQISLKRLQNLARAQDKSWCQKRQRVLSWLFFWWCKSWRFNSAGS